MPEAQPPPELNIPDSQHTVDVSIIDTTGYVSNIPVEGFIKPPVPGYKFIDAPCYSFLVKHNNPEAKSKYDHLIFDLGINKDWKNGPKATADRLQASDYNIQVEKNVIDILRDNGDDPQKVGAVVWSHYHFVCVQLIHSWATRWRLQYANEANRTTSATLRRLTRLPT